MLASREPILQSADDDRADYERWRVEYGFQQSAVDRMVADLSDHVEVPAAVLRAVPQPSAIAGHGMFAIDALAPGLIGPARIGQCRTWLGRLVNHSAMPNGRFAPYAGGLVLMATVPLAAGDELTVDYPQAGSVNGWALSPDLAATAETLRQRAARLAHREGGWTEWAGMDGAALHEFVQGLLTDFRHLPSLHVLDTMPRHDYGRF